MEYPPKPFRKGFPMPFGYFPSHENPTILLPDKKMLNALHYAFRMRAKYTTPFRDCCMWLHAATGRITTASGFRLMYKKWVKRLRKENMTRIQNNKRALLKKHQKFIDENYAHFGIKTDDREDATALAYEGARKTIKAKEKEQTG